MAAQFFIDKRPHKGLTFYEYFEAMQLKANTTDQSNLSVEDRIEYEHVKLNYQRSSRIIRTHKLNDNLCLIINKITSPQLWMVLTEDWCGDSAQNLPYIVKIAECNPKINLRILFRDQNTDIIDLYLTDGKTRSIPKLVVFNEKGDELFQWGPRPKEARELVTKLKSEGFSKEDYISQLHLWYGRNRGKNLEDEFIQIIEALIDNKAIPVI
jgi:hypothetical protein